ncbi:MAG: hypothetical protein KC619_16890 [Myxococcales bacterium]|nr:hypothetical protein [Myxococcales bacterium]
MPEVPPERWEAIREQTRSGVVVELSSVEIADALEATVDQDNRLIRLDVLSHLPIDEDGRRPLRSAERVVAEDDPEFEELDPPPVAGYLTLIALDVALKMESKQLRRRGRGPHTREPATADGHAYVILIVGSPPQYVPTALIR